MVYGRLHFPNLKPSHTFPNISVNISGGPKKLAKLLVGHNIKTAQMKFHKNNFTQFFFLIRKFCFKSHCKLSKRWTTNEEIIAAWKFGDQKSNIGDTGNIGCVLYALCMIYCWNKKVPGLSNVYGAKLWSFLVSSYNSFTIYSQSDNLSFFSPFFCLKIVWPIIINQSLLL